MTVHPMLGVLVQSALYSFPPCLLRRGQHALAAVLNLDRGHLGAQAQAQGGAHHLESGGGHHLDSGAQAPLPTPPAPHSRPRPTVQVTQSI